MTQRSRTVRAEVAVMRRHPPATSTSSTPEASTCCRTPSSAEAIRSAAIPRVSARTSTVTGSSAMNRIPATPRWSSASSTSSGGRSAAGCEDPTSTVGSVSVAGPRSTGASSPGSTMRVPSVISMPLTRPPPSAAALAALARLVGRRARHSAPRRVNCRASRAAPPRLRANHARRSRSDPPVAARDRSHRA